MAKHGLLITLFFSFLSVLSAQTAFRNIDSLQQQNQELVESIIGSLESSQQFDYSFSEYSYIKSIVSPDQLVRLLTWCFKDSLGVYHYSGIVLLRKSKKSKAFEIQQLHDVHLDIPVKSLEVSTLSPQQWLGSQYIEIFQLDKSSQKQMYYLLGVQRLNEQIIRRVIEPLVIEGNNLQFGHQVFKRRTQKTVRYLFEYNAISTMQMNFNPKTKAIEYTHNIPPNAAALHSSPFAPDIKYNALIYKKGEWQLTDIFKQYNPNLTTTPIQYKKRQNKQFWKTPE